MADYDTTTWSPDALTTASETTSATLNNATLSGTLTVTGATLLSSTLTVEGATQLNSTLTIGVDDSGYDVKFFGATSGRYILWDESNNALELTDNVNLNLGNANDMRIYHDGSNSYIANYQGALKIATESSGIAVSIGHTSSETTVNDNLTVTGTTTLNSTLAIGSDGTGHDVTFYGDTSTRNLIWDESENRLRANDNAAITVGTGNDCTLSHSGSETFLNCIGDLSLVITSGTLKLGTESAQPVSIGHTTSETTVNDNLTVTGFLRIPGNQIYLDDTNDCILSYLNGQGLKLSAITTQTDDMIPNLFIQHTTTSTPAVGLGSSILFSVEAPAGSHQGMAIGTLISDATSGAEDFDFLVSLCDNGATVSNAAPQNTEKFRVTSDGKIRLQGNVIQASDGGDTITMDTSDNVTIAGYMVEGRTQIKIPPTAFRANDDGIGVTHIVGSIEDDGSNFGMRPGSVSLEFFAYIDVPLGYTATKVQVTGSDTANEVEVYTLDLDDGTIGSEISNSGLTVADDTALASNHVGANDKMLLIKVATTAVDDLIYGGYVTIQAT